MSNTAIVEGFIDAWNRMDWDAVMGALDDDVVYHNIPMEVINGKAAAEEFIRGMQPQSVNWEILAIAESGNKVLTERVDSFLMAEDKPLSIAVMGTFEINGGKITAWRDYFDLGQLTSQME